MGLFGNDKEQDARIEAIEYHVRLISDALQQGQLDLAALTVKVMGLQAQVGDKLSASDIDPGVVTLHGQLAEARVELDKASTAAAESWSTLHAGANEALKALRQSVSAAATELEEKLKD